MEWFLIDGQYFITWNEHEWVSEKSSLVTRLRPIKFALKQSKRIFPSRYRYLDLAKGSSSVKFSSSVRSVENSSSQGQLSLMNGNGSHSRRRMTVTWKRNASRCIVRIRKHNIDSSQYGYRPLAKWSHCIGTVNGMRLLSYLQLSSYVASWVELHANTAGTRRVVRLQHCNQHAHLHG